MDFSKKALVMVDHEMRLMLMCSDGRVEEIGSLVHDNGQWGVMFRDDVVVSLQVVYEVEGILREWNRVVGSW